LSPRAVSSQSTLVNHPFLPASAIRPPDPSSTAPDSIPADDISSDGRFTKISAATAESRSPVLPLPTIDSRLPTISSRDTNFTAPAVDESHDIASVKDSSKQSIAPTLPLPAGVITSQGAQLAGSAQRNFSNPPPPRQPARSLGSSLQSQEISMVRIGIRWQLAALVVISSLIGLAVIAIATWVSLWCSLKRFLKTLTLIITDHKSQLCPSGY
jgi:hypothetical protein